MSKFDWKALVGTVAPGIATALGGPLAGVAVKALSTAILGKPDAPEAELAAALQSASPDTLLKLKEADRAFEAHMADLGVDLEKIAAGDRDSARNMRIATGDHTATVLAIAITIGFFGILVYLLVYGLPVQGGDAMLIMLGALGAAFGSVIQFYFGSSVGSKNKTDAMAAAIKR